MQQVNLYTEEFRPKKDLLAFRNMLAVAAVLLVVCVLYSAYLAWDVRTHEQTLAVLNTANSSMQQEVDGLQAQLEARARDSRLQNENEVLKIRLHNTRLLLAAIEEGINDEGIRQRFGDILLALAKHRIEPVWLSQIQILESGERLSLVGHTREPDQVPVYLRSLGQEAALSGRSFNLFNIEQPEQTPELRTFKVDTQAADVPDAQKQSGKRQASSNAPSGQLSSRPTLAEPSFSSPGPALTESIQRIGGAS